MMAQRREPGVYPIRDRWTDKTGNPTKDNGRGKRWVAPWVDLDGKERKRSFERKIEAKQFLETKSASILRNEYVDPTHSRQTIHTVYERWLNTQTQWKQSTKRNRIGNYTNHVQKHWGRRELGSVRRTEVKEWLAEQYRNGVSYQNLKLAVLTLKSVFDYAIEDSLITVNPFENIKLPKSTKAKQRNYLTITQVEQLSAAMPSLQGFILFQAYTGLRFGESTAITLQDIQPETRKITINKAWERDGGKQQLGTTKTGKERIVYYPQRLDSTIVELSEGKKPSDYLFLSHEGHPLRNDNFNKRVYSKAIKYCVETYEDFPVVTIHDLRHTAASLAISVGANVKAVQRMLGHASASMTLDVYTDLFDDDLVDVSERLDNAIGVAMGSLAK